MAVKKFTRRSGKSKSHTKKSRLNKVSGKITNSVAYSKGKLRAMKKKIQTMITKIKKTLKAKTR